MNEEHLPPPPAAQPEPQPPRNVPMLTEALGPTPAAAPAAPASSPPPAVLDTTVDALLARLGPQLEHDIAEAISRVLHEQMLGFHPRVRKAVADVVRENIAKTALHGKPD